MTESEFLMVRKALASVSMSRAIYKTLASDLESLAFQQSRQWIRRLQQLLPKDVQDVLVGIAKKLAHRRKLERIPTSFLGVPREVLYCLAETKDAKFHCVECGTFAFPLLAQGVTASFCSYKCMNASPQTLLKRRSTCKERFGCEEPNHSAAISAKRNARVRRVQREQHEEILRKKRETSLKRFGVEHHMHLSSYQEATSMQNRLHETGRLALQNYKLATGYDNPMQNPKVKRKVRATCRARFGTDNAAQSMEVRDKISLAKRGKPTGNSPHLKGRKCLHFVDSRGIEHALDSSVEATAIELVYELGALSVVSDTGEVPRIKYAKEGEAADITHWYYPDLDVRFENTRVLLECKSVYTLTASFGANVDKALAARKACKKKGAEFWMLIKGKHETLLLKNPTMHKLQVAIKKLTPGVMDKRLPFKV